MQKKVAHDFRYDPRRRCTSRTEISKLNILEKLAPHRKAPILLTIKVTYPKSLQRNYSPKWECHFEKFVSKCDQSFSIFAGVVVKPINICSNMLTVKKSCISLSKSWKRTGRTEVWLHTYTHTHTHTHTQTAWEENESDRRDLINTHI